MKFMVIDTEGSGLFDFKRPADADGQPRLASLAIVVLDENLVETARHGYYVKPDGWDMHPDATAINGLTTEFLHEHGIPIKDVLHGYTALVLDGHAVIAHNAQFDCKAIRAELRRAEMDDLFELTPNICTMRGAMKLSPKVVKLNNKGGFPGLADLCAHFGIERAGVHTALGDALDTAECVRRMVAGGFELKPEVHHAKDYDAIKNAK